MGKQKGLGLGGFPAPPGKNGDAGRINDSGSSQKPFLISQSNKFSISCCSYPPRRKKVQIQQSAFRNLIQATQQKLWGSKQTSDRVRNSREPYERGRKRDRDGCFRCVTAPCFPAGKGSPGFHSKSFIWKIWLRVNCPSSFIGRDTQNGANGLKLLSSCSVCEQVKA